MKNDELQHVTLTIIDSSLYKKLRPFLIVGFLASYFLSFVFTFPAIVIYLLIGLNILVPIIMYLYSKNFQSKGILAIDENNIIISKHNTAPIIVPITSISAFKISRGSEVHYDTGIYPPETHNNWITFAFNNQSYKLEFAIADKTDNENFEDVIQILRQKHPAFLFESI